MTLTIGFKTHVGLVRKGNQDSYAVLRRGDLSNRLDALLVLADGMGGTGGGDIASRIVAQTVPDTILEFLYDRSGSALDVEQMLLETFMRANHKVWAHRKFERPDLKQMGTTCVAAILSEELLTVANLGDSRAYLLRGGKLSQLTEDHSEVWQEVLAERMTREEAQRSRFRNRITRAIGLGPEVKTDIFRVPLQGGDTVLLCSDGLSSEIRDAEIARILACNADVQDVCEQLVAAALDHGGHDNVTVVTMRYGDFVPLALPLTTDEDDTDPDQKWRENLRNRPSEDEEDEEDEMPGPPSRRPESRSGRSEPEPISRRSGQQTNSTNGMLVGLVILLGVVAAAEGYLLSTSGFGVAPKKEPTEKIAPPPRPAYDLRNYGAPKLLTNKEVQEGVLLIDGQGSPIVAASSSGNLVHVRSNGDMDRLGGTFPSLPADVLSDSRRTHFAPTHVDFALDPAGNLFVIDAETKSIRIFSRDGTRVGNDIGRGLLKAPVRIQVNADDVIFVIDNHKLYRIETTVLTGH